MKQSKAKVAGYGEDEQAIQREMADVADRLDEQRRRLKALMRRLEGLPSMKAAEAAADGDLDLHVVADLMGSLEIAAGNLGENVADLRQSAKATPASLAAKVRRRKLDGMRSDAQEAQRRQEQ